MDLDIWDYLTFLTFFIIALGVVGLAVFILGLPGKIAIARNHPDAEAVNLMGWLGFIAIVPWVNAFIWAFKPTDIVVPLMAAAIDILLLNRPRRTVLLSLLPWFFLMIPCAISTMQHGSVRPSGSTSA